ncbi:hypothetical protein HAX54_028014, partial [Datura stramonium]|nr:hypothetical protein [Datura stramonium]
ICPTFHVSQVKKKLGPYTASPTLPIVHTHSSHVILKPEVVIDRWVVPKHG